MHVRDEITGQQRAHAFSGNYQWNGNGMTVFDALPSLPVEFLDTRRVRRQAALQLAESLIDTDHPCLGPPVGALAFDMEVFGGVALFNQPGRHGFNRADTNNAVVLFRYVLKGHNVTGHNACPMLNLFHDLQPLWYGAFSGAWSHLALYCLVLRFKAGAIGLNMTERKTVHSYAPKIEKTPT
uniref:hypothetical protein n=1 Tax=Pseudomonas sp. TH31 TaxID=2796396 RepID=UPI001F5C0006|nr:hypothetical protein [Pseudomonas sp. TH31]